MMVYCGTKTKYLKDIVPIIQDYIDTQHITEFYDIFYGGANVIDKINCKNLYRIDLSPSLIALHQQAQLDFNKISQNYNREDWDKAYSNWKNYVKAKRKECLTMPLYQVGAIEWYTSYGTRGSPADMQKIRIRELTIVNVDVIMKSSQKVKIIKR